MVLFRARNDTKQLAEFSEDNTHKWVFLVQLGGGGAPAARGASEWQRASARAVSVLPTFAPPILPPTPSSP